MKRKRGFAVPFVITATALSQACGGSTDGDPSSTGGAGGTAGSGTGGTSGSGGVGGTSGVGGGGVGGGGTGGTGTDAGACPPTLPAGWDSCTLPPDVRCKYTVECQSGTIEIEVTCATYGWDVVPKACDKPFDSCPGTQLYCNNGWTMPQGTNPPSPCPADKPLPGDACFAGAFGGVWENCGYPCDPVTKQGWTIATCPLPDAGSESNWSYDGVCPP